MTVKTPSENRDKKGRFTKNNKVGTGRKKGSRNHATVAALTLMEGQLEVITQKLIDAALEGDLTAAKIILDKLIPTAKESPLPQINLPNVDNIQDLPNVTSAILQALVNDGLLPSQAQILMQLMNTHEKYLSIAQECKHINIQTSNTLAASPNPIENYRRALRGDFAED